MNPVLIGQLLTYLAFVPDAISIVSNTVDAVKKLKEKGEVTQDDLDALAARILSQHEELPKPE